MTASVTVTGTRAARLRIKRIKKNAGDMTTTWPRVGRYLSGIMSQQFITQGARLGTPWKPVKPEYRLWKLRHGFSRKTLQQTGALKKDFTGRPMDIEHYTAHSADFGSDDPKAVWHHKGTHNKAGKQVNPARPLLRATPEIRAEIRSIIKHKIVGK